MRMIAITIWLLFNEKINQWIETRTAPQPI